MKTVFENRSMLSFRWILVAASLFWMGALLSGCGRTKNESGAAAPAPTVNPAASQNLPRQNMIVRVHQNSGRAEYAAANFDPNGNRQNLDGVSQDQNLKWTAVNPQSVINQQNGYPKATDNQFYFVQNPRDFRAAAQTPGSSQQLPTFVDDSAHLMAQNHLGYNFGYYNYPYYDGSFYYGNQRFLHNYPVNPFAFYNNYNFFNYQPVFYNNFGYNYFMPAYYYSLPAYGFNYYYYSYWW
jgi:hypothetical protein